MLCGVRLQAWVSKTEYLTLRKDLFTRLENLLKSSPSRSAVDVVKDDLKDLMKKHKKYKNDRTFVSTWKSFKKEANGKCASSKKAYKKKSNARHNPVNNPINNPINNVTQSTTQSTLRNAKRKTCSAMLHCSGLVPQQLQTHT